MDFIIEKCQEGKTVCFDLKYLILLHRNNTVVRLNLRLMAVWSFKRFKIDVCLNVKI